MSSEANFWRDIVYPALSLFGVLKRVENRVGLGTPDVAYCLRFRRLPPVSGWLELKHLDRWPKGQVKIDHLTLEQVRWHEEWEGAGGRVWTLLRVQRDYLLLDAAGTRFLYNGPTRPNLIAAARVSASGKFPLAKILEAMVA